MKRAGYREAIDWIARNDDNNWLDDEQPVISVAAALVQDLFGLDSDRVIRDLRRAIAKARGSK